MPYLKGDTEPPAGCIFCNKIAADDAAEHVLCRGQTCFVTLNLFPYNNGHLMVVPYRHVPSLEQLDAAELAELMQLAQRSLGVLRAVYTPDGFNVGVNIGEAAGAGVADHVHMHVVPRWAGDTNYMTSLGRTRVIPEWVDDTYRCLRPLFDAPDEA